MPFRRPLRPGLRAFAIAGLVIGTIITVLSLFSSRLPALDIVNDFLPLTLGGIVLVLLLTVIAAPGRLVVAVLFLLTVNSAYLVQGMQGGASDAPEGSQHFLRIASLNLGARNERMDEVANFLSETDPDIIVFQEMKTPALRDRLKSRYPYVAGTWGLVLLSKFPLNGDGRIDRLDSHGWSRNLVNWATLTVKGTTFTLAGVHLERPYYAEAQMFDVSTVASFVRNQAAPVILVGDFNMTPWSMKLQHIAEVTGLKRFNTFHPTWPMQIHEVPLVPFAAIDNVLAAGQFQRLSLQTGPRLGSDHRPIIADIALPGTTANANNEKGKP